MARWIGLCNSAETARSGCGRRVFLPGRIFDLPWVVRFGLEGGRQDGGLGEIAAQTGWILR